MTKFLNISTDNTLGGNSPSDVLVSSQKAIKDYVDSNANNVVWVTYNSTPFADIRAAMQAGKIVLLKYTTNWNEYILRATNLILGTTEYIYFTALDTYTHVAYARVSSTEAWIYGGQTNQSSISDLSTIRSGAAAGATAVQPGDLATVATTGAYSDLSGTPTIPTVNNPTITITQGGVTKGSFTLNQASGDTIALDAGGGSGLPDQTGHAGEYLTTDGTNASWSDAVGYHPDLFDHKWADHILNDVSWLRADTFSWQAGSVYQAAYQHLADDITGKTLQNETISGTTIQFYLADDGHKICPASEESNVTTIYNATGVAWYYILDTVNQRFKLPRTKFGFTGIRSGVGDYVEAGLPNITGSSYGYVSSRSRGASGALQMSGGSSKDATGGGGWWVESVTVSVNASNSSSIYGNSDTVQPKATEMYLYFYVGNFTQTALENTAGVTTEVLNDKADLDFGNTNMIDYVIEKQEPTSANSYTWYRKYKSGWVEQGGHYTHNNVQGTVTTTLVIAMADTHYDLQITKEGGSAANATTYYEYMSIYNNNSKTTTSFKVQMTAANRLNGYDWQVSGIAAS